MLSLITATFCITLFSHIKSYKNNPTVLVPAKLLYNDLEHASIGEIDIDYSKYLQWQQSLPIPVSASQQDIQIIITLSILHSIAPNLGTSEITFLKSVSVHFFTTQSFTFPKNVFTLTDDQLRESISGSILRETYLIDISELGKYFKEILKAPESLPDDFSEKIELLNQLAKNWKNGINLALENFLSGVLKKIDLGRAVTDKLFKEKAVVKTFKIDKASLSGLKTLEIKEKDEKEKERRIKKVIIPIKDFVGKPFEIALEVTASDPEKLEKVSVSMITYYLNNNELESLKVGNEDSRYRTEENSYVKMMEEQIKIIMEKKLEGGNLVFRFDLDTGKRVYYRMFAYYEPRGLGRNAAFVVSVSAVVGILVVVILMIGRV